MAVAFVAHVLVGRALRPVAEMTAQAADWSEHDVDRRFAMARRATSSRDSPQRLTPCSDG